MSNISIESVNGESVLTYKYESKRDIDDIIIQLIDDSTQTGFLKISINRRDGALTYPISGLSPFSEYKPVKSGRRVLYNALKDLREKLVFLEDAFIDSEYIAFNSDYVFADPATGKIYLVVIPVANVPDKMGTLSELLAKYVEKYAANETYVFRSSLLDHLTVPITNSHQMKGIFAYIESTLSEAPETDTTDTSDISDIAVNADSDSSSNEVFSEISDDEVFPEIPDDSNTDAGQKSFEKMLFSDANMPSERKNGRDTKNFGTKATEDTKISGTKATEDTKISGRKATEDTKISRRKATADTKIFDTKATADTKIFDTKATADTKLFDTKATADTKIFDTKATADTKLYNKKTGGDTIIFGANASVDSDPKAAPVQEPDMVPAFLFRKKTGEIIPISGSTFVIGKVPFVCDYVVADNPTLSRIHAMIRYKQEEKAYYIIDCNSTNHVYLGGSRIADSSAVKLTDNVRIHMSTEEFVFNCR